MRRHGLHLVQRTAVTRRNPVPTISGYMAAIVGWIMLGGVAGCRTPGLQQGEKAALPPEPAVLAARSGDATTQPDAPRMRMPGPLQRAHAQSTPAPQPPGVVAADGGGSPMTDPSPPTGTPNVAGDEAAEGYRLQPGDPVMVIMRGTENTQVEDILDPEGYIVLPFIGRINVLGLTPSELELKITNAYVPDYYRYLSVTVLIQTQRSFYVKGEVRSPTRYPYVQGMTLLRAVSAAGGPTDFANQKRVTISRKDQVLGPYSLIEILRDPTKDVLIEPEDVIDVPQKPW